MIKIENDVHRECDDERKDQGWSRMPKLRSRGRSLPIRNEQAKVRTISVAKTIGGMWVRNMMARVVVMSIIAFNAGKTSIDAPGVSFRAATASFQISPCKATARAA